MAVIAQASAGTLRVMGVLFDVFGHRSMTLEARLIAIHTGGKLIFRVAVVHRVARQTGHVTMLKAGRLNHGGVFSPCHSSHAIWPELLLKSIGDLFQHPLDPRFVAYLIRNENQAGVFQIVARSVLKPPDIPSGHVFGE